MIPQSIADRFKNGKDPINTCEVILTELLKAKGERNACLKCYQIVCVLKQAFEIIPNWYIGKTKKAYMFLNIRIYYLKYLALFVMYRAA